jgi:hypothetical protein
MKIRAISRGKLTLLLTAFCAAILASSDDAKAIGYPLPSINLAIGDQRELGQVHPAISEGDAAITQYVNFMISLSLNGSGHVIVGPHDNLVIRSMNNFGALPSAAALALRGKDTIDLGTQGTYDYLFAHYGGPRGGFAEIWYVGDLSGKITIPGNAFRHGLSGWALFTGPNSGVPDGGATVMMLGAALGILGALRRYLF